MSVALVTGAGGLIGSEATRYLAAQGMDVVGIDNDMRSRFFGAEASTANSVAALKRSLRGRYRHHDVDIRDRETVADIVKGLGTDLSAVLHTAAQPSHDWAAREPFTDFDINAVGTLNLLEATRMYAPDVPFLFTSTNKVYGDRPNELPLVELETRYEIDSSHTYSGGIREDMSIDSCLHSLFGASKVAADVLVQEYGRYFGMATVCFRGGTLTGPGHAATELHGFLAYVMRCAMTGTTYRVFGYRGKQVRDAIHSNDLVRAFWEFIRSPRSGAVYNIGGGRFSNCSVMEALSMASDVVGEDMDREYVESNRVGDHVWWIGDNGAFERDYPSWQLEYDVPRILKEIYEANHEDWVRR